MPDRQISLGVRQRLESGRDLLERTLATMARVLGEDHPDTVDRARGRRAECDLEPSPT